MKKLFIAAVFVFLGVLVFFALSSSICIGCEPTGLVTGSVSSFDFNESLEEDVVLIDIRTPREYEQGHIDGAVNIDFYSSDFVFSLSELDKSANYLIYCRSGSRSAQTLALMKDMGFDSVQELSGGINSWKSSGLPVVFS